MLSRARVFISCGQASPEEREIAREISRRLREQNYDPYVAVEEQSLRGLKENIFRQLESSEYMVFVDFRRGEVHDSGQVYHRGSLFSHQELAIAASRELDVIVLREQGIRLEGISQFVQENALEFSDRQHVAAIVSEEVRRRKWDSTWRNELSLTDRPPISSVASRCEYDSQGRIRKYEARFWHVQVTNRHRDKAAVNCYAYLEKIKNCQTQAEQLLQTIEFKWAGYVLPNALILPRTSRPFDAFYVPTVAEAPQYPSLLRFNFFSDWTGLIPHINERGEYEFTFRVVAENFPSTAAVFAVKVPDDPANASLRHVGDVGSTSTS